MVRGMRRKVAIIGPPNARVIIPAGPGGIRTQGARDVTYLVTENAQPLLLNETNDAGGALSLA